MKCLVCDFILETICSSMIFIFYFIRILFMIYCYAIVNGVFKVCNGIFYFMTCACIEIFCAVYQYM